MFLELKSLTGKEQISGGFRLQSGVCPAAELMLPTAPLCPSLPVGVGDPCLTDEKAEV